MKTSILLLHGALGSAAQFDPLIEILQTEGHEAKALSFPGHGGRASEGPFSMTAFVDTVLRETDPRTPLRIFGYSMGGYVALLLAARHEDRVAGVATLGTKLDWTPESAAAEASRLDPETIQTKVPAFAEMLAKRHHPADWAEVVRNTAGLLNRLGQAPDLHPDTFARIRIPVCIGRGGADNMVTESESVSAARAMPNGRYQELPGVKHPLEQVSTEVLLNFVKNTILAL